MTAPRTLADLKPGQEALVAELTGEGELCRRLLELGLIPGTRAAMLRAAPFGDPLLVRARGCTLALRRADASHVALAPPEGGRV